MSCVPSQDLPDRQMVASLVQALPPVIIQLRYILEELHSMRYKVEKYLAIKFTNILCGVFIFTILSLWFYKMLF